MKFELYRDSKKEWRWRLIASNGRKIATSGEGYKRRVDAVAAIILIQTGAMNAEVVKV
jgi:uncharacterized protein YegP (UPF0339 family)